VSVGFILVIEMKIIGVILSLIFLTTSYGQRVIAVQNPSFEKNQLWHSCIFAGQHILNTEADKKALVSNLSDHNIVSKVDGAFEGISQSLVIPIHNHTCYQFTFYARRDSGYNVKQEIINLKANAGLALNVYIYGANANCGFGELLASPQPIQNHQWTKYMVTLRSIHDWSHINIYAVSADNKPYNGYVLLHQQGPLVPVFCPTMQVDTSSLVNLVKVHPASMLTFGGILMLYEVGPRSINIFDRKGEIIPSTLIRRDESRNSSLDSVLNQYRGIDFLFLLLKTNKYRNKRLNLISYLKTKYPEILEHSRIMRYASLPSNLYKKEDQTGDLLIVENINDKIGSQN
jgi:hypothetical protein